MPQAGTVAVDTPPKQSSGTTVCSPLDPQQQRQQQQQSERQQAFLRSLVVDPYAAHKREDSLESFLFADTGDSSQRSLQHPAADLLLPESPAHSMDDSSSLHPSDAATVGHDLYDAAANGSDKAAMASAVALLPSYPAARIPAKVIPASVSSVHGNGSGHTTPLSSVAAPAASRSTSSTPAPAQQSQPAAPAPSAHAPAPRSRKVSSSSSSSAGGGGGAGGGGEDSAPAAPRSRKTSSPSSSSAGGGGGGDDAHAPAARSRKVSSSSSSSAAAGGEDWFTLTCTHAGRSGVEFVCLLKKASLVASKGRKKDVPPRALQGFLCIREVQAKLLNTLKKYKGRSEQSSRSSIRQELEKLHYLPFAGSASDVALLKARGVIKHNAPGTSLYTLGHMVSFLRFQRLEKGDPELLQAADDLERGYAEYAARKRIELVQDDEPSAAASASGASAEAKEWAAPSSTAGQSPSRSPSASPRLGPTAPAARRIPSTAPKRAPKPPSRPRPRASSAAPRRRKKARVDSDEEDYNDDHGEGAEEELAPQVASRPRARARTATIKGRKSAQREQQYNADDAYRRRDDFDGDQQEEEEQFDPPAHEGYDQHSSQAYQPHSNQSYQSHASQSYNPQHASQYHPQHLHVPYRAALHPSGEGRQVVRASVVPGQVLPSVAGQGMVDGVGVAGGDDQPMGLMPWTVEPPSNMSLSLTSEQGEAILYAARASNAAQGQNMSLSLTSEQGEAILYAARASNAAQGRSMSLTSEQGEALFSAARASGGGDGGDLSAGSGGDLDGPLSAGSARNRGHRRRRSDTNRFSRSSEQFDSMPFGLNGMGSGGGSVGVMGLPGGGGGGGRVLSPPRHPLPSHSHVPSLGMLPAPFGLTAPGHQRSRSRQGLGLPSLGPGGVGGQAGVPGPRTSSAQGHRRDGSLLPSGLAMQDSLSSSSARMWADHAIRSGTNGPSPSTAPGAPAGSMVSPSSAAAAAANGVGGQGASSSALQVPKLFNPVGLILSGLARGSGAISPRSPLSPSPAQGQQHGPQGQGQVFGFTSPGTGEHAMHAAGPGGSMVSPNGLYAPGTGSGYKRARVGSPLPAGGAFLTAPGAFQERESSSEPPGAQGAHGAPPPMLSSSSSVSAEPPLSYRSGIAPLSVSSSYAPGGPLSLSMFSPPGSNQPLNVGHVRRTSLLSGFNTLRRRSLSEMDFTPHLAAPMAGSVVPGAVVPARGMQELLTAIGNAPMQSL